MTFDQLLAAIRSDNELVLPQSWGQGRATFGGLVAALTFERMAALVPEERAMRSLQTSFVGPVEPGVPARFESELLREGRAVTQVQGRIVQNGEVRLVCLASFGGERESAVRVDALPAPEAASVELCQDLPYIEGVTPAFTRHIEMRWAFGHMPFTGKGGREMGGWMQFRDRPEVVSDAHIVALVDAWPPALLPHLKAPAPASSLSWALDILHPRPALEPGDWLLYRAGIDQAGAGYGHTHAGIWTASGELVALSRQTVTVFA
ncbi:thioesterase family protein [Marinobacter salinisoli]|uniref:Thioesterase family protein n=1 Tax=Marinobacter salinisoli TaxID=2769486 RepID=A0ABX7MV38_9GAMM|nr:thioesterase family protein [Marinobacter salinisoli]QSP96189.1 thioesterase family protein [Marinobacter salinisoli]